MSQEKYKAIISLTYPLVTFKEKNDWIKDQLECDSDIGMEEVDSTCYYFDIFDDSSIDYVDF